MLSSLRKSFAVIEGHDDQQKILTNTKACTPFKGLRVDEIGTQKEKRRVLTARLKKLQEINVRINEEAEHDHTRFEELMDVNMICMICRDTMQNPQRHTACYSCLRKLWTQPPPQDDRAELIDTDAESDLDEDEGAKDDAEVVEPAPRPRRRHQFTSAVNRKKHCPYCKKLITRRPVRNYRLREISETLGSDLPLNKAPSARRCRNDIWHGIFHSENRDAGHLGPEYLVEVGDVEEVMVRRERARLEAFEEGRRRGILETRQRWARAEEARRIAMARPITMHDVRFGQGNPLWAGHAPLVAIAVPRPAAVPIPQVPEALPAQDAPPI
ncbi:hypothetical protein Clacol_008941 [Clathrus columnatus]|uniref:Uncharacterized protein n=1 Tax=Clathrus columnatus TaxID=1419009 RepID=A0AAV5APB8_9AGAM|nr:hypothetical protein Clacol_008941 [Clathrus columnatus]